METEQLETRKIAEYEAIKLVNKNDNNAIELIPGYGGRLNGLWLSDKSVQQNVIDGYQDDKDLLDDTYYHNVWLFPFINRLEAGAYKFEGNKYQFPINEPERGNALHGFLFNQAFEVEEIGSVGMIPFIKLKYQYDGEYSYYPFPFDLSITYKLKVSNILEIEVNMKNTGEKNAPLSFGWHPYFTFNQNIQNVKVTIPAQQRVAVNQNLIPTGELIKDDRFLKGRAVLSDQLDDNFKLESFENYKVTLSSDQGHAQIMMEFDRSMKYIQMFTPPKRKSIAIEPVTSNINAFNNGDGLMKIEPGQSFSTTFKIMLTRTI